MISGMRIEKCRGTNQRRVSRTVPDFENEMGMLQSSALPMSARAKLSFDPFFCFLKGSPWPIKGAETSHLGSQRRVRHRQIDVVARLWTCHGAECRVQSAVLSVLDWLRESLRCRAW